MCRRWRFRLRRALGISPATTLNIYTCRFIDPALLGDATWPWRSAESDLLHGVAIHFATLPGGAMETYNLGDNAVHEVLKQLTFKDGASICQAAHTFYTSPVWGPFLETPDNTPGLKTILCVQYSSTEKLL